MVDVIRIYKKQYIYIYKKTKKKQCHHDPIGKRGERAKGVCVEVGGGWIERDKKKARVVLYAKGDVCWRFLYDSIGGSLRRAGIGGR